MRCMQCGLVLSIRSTGNLINVWNRTANAVAENRDMEQYMKDMLHCDELSYVCAPHSIKPSARRVRHAEHGMPYRPDTIQRTAHCPTRLSTAR